ncbi:MAG TPA: hypothetical protein VFQ51_07040 [Vicinamibacteria bacterium]|nr:hypothetical protein [Vicinamibacteria bacterium]
MKGLWALAAVSLLAAAPATVEAQFFQERFDTYTAGTTIAGQGGWETWDNNPAADTTVVNTQSFSAPNSLLVAGPADIVHRFTGVNSGTWYIRTRTYIPSTQQGEAWFILLNQYAPSAPDNDWSVQLVQCAAACLTGGVTPGQVLNFGGSGTPGGGTATLLTDQWVDVRVEVNFTSSTYSIFYNEVMIDTQPWFSTGSNQLQAMDLFSNTSTVSFMDNVWVDTTVPVNLQEFQVE